MILATLVWAYWVCLLLSGDGVAMPVKEKGHSYRISPVSSNLEDSDDSTLDEPDEWEDLQLDYDQLPLWGESSQSQALNGLGPGAEVPEQHHGVSPPDHSLGSKPSGPQDSDRRQPSAYQPASNGFTNSNKERQAGHVKMDFERIFQFPQEDFQQTSAHRGQLPSYPASMGWPVGFPTDHRRVPSWQKVQLSTREVGGSRASPPSSYISQYRGHYTQGRSKFSRDSYSPNVHLPLTW
ncbi:uncharacterized protein LOC133541714 [Nerophis ophidion]|uniref:uncharacterized protein LOC133541714 n=1 Tax=Nerophis ophidion TaxID=159077 RepID=UPI002ADFC208|nr:uncharacterized protein LOC133541714 [Nerophis ophidion]